MRERERKRERESEREREKRERERENMINSIKSWIYSHVRAVSQNGIN